MSLLNACGDPNEPPSGRPPTVREAAFVDRAAAAGLDFVHFNGMAGEYHMAELMGAGAALFDYDNDGDLDAYLVQGTTLSPDTSNVPESPTDRLYRNDTPPGGAPRFTDVTTESGLDQATGYGMGVAAGDYDNDGLVDLYVTNYGANQLLKNRGGSFADVTASAGAGDDRWSVPATFFDYDRDGWLDLYVGNYLVYSHASALHCNGPSGRRDYCGASHFAGAADRLLHNRGDGSFEEVESAVTGTAGRALGALAADLDGDGWQDLYVGNDAGPNNLWIGRDGSFSDQALLAGAALNADGRAEASMGIDAADYDGDGDFDLFIGHLVVETNTLYRNLGGGVFEDASAASGLGPPSRTHTAFGTVFLDYDGDGRLDLFAANGAVQNIEALASRGDPFPFHEVNQLFRNHGEGSYRAQELPALSEVSRGVAAGDVDNDGDVDLLVANNNGPARLLINRSDPRRWAGLRLVTGRRDALGALAALELKSGPRWDRVASDGSYASASDPRLLFAIGDETIEGVRVRWPDGSAEKFPAVETGRYTTLRQGEGEVLR